MGSRCSWGLEPAFLGPISTTGGNAALNISTWLEESSDQALEGLDTLHELAKILRFKKTQIRLDSSSLSGSGTLSRRYVICSQPLV